MAPRRGSSAQPGFSLPASRPSERQLRVKIGRDSDVCFIAKPPEAKVVVPAQRVWFHRRSWLSRSWCCAPRMAGVSGPDCERRRPRQSNAQGGERLTAEHIGWLASDCHDGGAGTPVATPVQSGTLLGRDGNPRPQTWLLKPDARSATSCWPIGLPVRRSVMPHDRPAYRRHAHRVSTQSAVHFGLMAGQNRTASDPFEAPDLAG